MNAPDSVATLAPARPLSRSASDRRAEGSTEPAHLLIVSDQPVLRDAWASLFEARGYAVAGLAHDLSEARAAVASTAPDAILIDLPMDEVSARRTVAGFREQVGSGPTLVARWKRDGFLMSTGRGLPEAVPHPGTHELLSTLARALGGARHAACGPISNGCDPLTPRELEVIQRMASGITTNRELARALEVSENTVKYHVRHLLEKLQAKNRTQAVAIALRHRLIGSGSRTETRLGRTAPKS